MFTQQHVLVGIFAENVPNDHDGLLDDIVDLGLDEVQQGADTALGRLLCRREVNNREAINRLL